MLLHVEHVSVGEAVPGSRKPRWLLHNVSFTAQSGQFLCIVGAPGADTQLLLDVIAGFVQPTTGTVRVRGVRVRGPGPDRAVVFRGCSLFPWLSLVDNVAFGLQCQGMSLGNARVAALAHLRNVQLADFADAYPHQLSTAMRQRAAIARVWAIGSPIVLMDHPFAAVEDELRPALRAQLLDMWKRSGKTIVFVTDDPDEAARLGERVLVLAAAPGHIAADVRAKPGFAGHLVPGITEAMRAAGDMSKGPGIYVAEEAAGVDVDGVHEEVGDPVGDPVVDAAVDPMESFRRAIREAVAKAALRSGSGSSPGDGLQGSDDGSGGSGSSRNPSSGPHLRSS